MLSIEVSTLCKHLVYSELRSNSQLTVQRDEPINDKAQETCLFHDKILVFV